jgi:acetoin utilization protein AcuC
MDRPALIWDPELAAYDFGESHPLNPVRLTLAVGLMDAFGMLTPQNVISPSPASEEDLLLVHSPEYVAAVRRAGTSGADFLPTMGLGTGDDPVFPRMHEIASLTCGASIRGIEEVASGPRRRTFSIAGGMHHAHRDRAAGFCVYNDAAVGIAVARQRHHGLRILYVDIDAHHGDGVQEAFADTPDVMTISMHESGLYMFPGTGFSSEIGRGPGEGFAANVPMPPFATDECFALAFEEVVVPLARAFRPDLIVGQLGADAHHSDPLTDLGLTLPGYRRLVRGIIGLADELCDGRLAAVGGGGYRIVDVVPPAWSWVMAELSGLALPDVVPDAWRANVPTRLGVEPPTSMGESDRFDPPSETPDRLMALTTKAVREAREAVFPHHCLTA